MEADFDEFVKCYSKSVTVDGDTAPSPVSSEELGEDGEKVDSVECLPNSTEKGDFKKCSPNPSEKGASTESFPNPVASSPVSSVDFLDESTITLKECTNYAALAMGSPREKEINNHTSPLYSSGSEENLSCRDEDSRHYPRKTIPSPVSSVGLSTDECKSVGNVEIGGAISPVSSFNLSIDEDEKKTKIGKGDASSPVPSTSLNSHEEKKVIEIEVFNVTSPVSSLNLSSDKDDKKAEIEKGDASPLVSFFDLTDQVGQKQQNEMEEAASPVSSLNLSECPGEIEDPECRKNVAPSPVSSLDLSDDPDEPFSQPLKVPVVPKTLMNKHVYHATAPKPFMNPYDYYERVPRHKRALQWHRPGYERPISLKRSRVGVRHIPQTDIAAPPYENIGRIPPLMPEYHDYPHQKSAKRPCELTKKEEEAIADLKDIHQHECNTYRENPEIHPDYNHVKRKWFEDKKYMGVDLNDVTLQKEWGNYWAEKMEILFKESWKFKKEACLKRIMVRSDLKQSQASSDCKTQADECPYKSISNSIHGSHSRSPVPRSFSRSPIQRSYSRSPIRRSFSRSPIRRSRSSVHRSFTRSPIRRSFTPSPIHRSFSGSPDHRYFSHRSFSSRSPDRRRSFFRSPVHRSTSRSPLQRSRSRSPVHRSNRRYSHRSQSPVHRQYSRSPVLKSESKSPFSGSRYKIVFSRSRSPLPRYFSPDPSPAHNSSTDLFRKSPIHKYRSPYLRSPIHRSKNFIGRSRSPMKRGRSPIHRSRSPLQRARSPIRGSRSGIQRMRSPLHGSRRSVRSRSPTFRSKSPVPKSRSSKLGSRAVNTSKSLSQANPSKSSPTREFSKHERSHRLTTSSLGSSSRKEGHRVVSSQNINSKENHSSQVSASSSSSTKRERDLVLVTRLLAGISDSLGPFGISLKVLHSKLSNAFTKRKDVMQYIDEDAKILFKVISDKLKDLLSDKSLGLQKKSELLRASNGLDLILESLNRGNSSRKSDCGSARTDKVDRRSDILGYSSVKSDRIDRKSGQLSYASKSSEPVKIMVASYLPQELRHLIDAKTGALNFNEIAKKTLGMHVVDSINLLKQIVSPKSEDSSQDNLLKIYLTVKDIQRQLIDK